jgi:hypothetical protein
MHNHYKTVMFGKAKIFTRNGTGEQAEFLTLFRSDLLISTFQFAERVRP